MPGDEGKARCAEGKGCLPRVPKSPAWNPLNDRVCLEVSNQGGCCDILDERLVMSLQETNRALSSFPRAWAWDCKVSFARRKTEKGQARPRPSQQVMTHLYQILAHFSYSSRSSPDDLI